MLYHEHQITQSLSDYIQSIWAMESENDADVYPRSLIMPDGIVEIVFHYETPLYSWQDDIQTLQADNFAVSMMRKYVEIGSSGKTGFIAVRFFPWGAYHFFDEPIQNFLDRSVDATKLWGNKSREIILELKSFDILEKRFKSIEQFLLKMLKQYKKDEAEIDDAIKLIRQTRGILSIESVCKKTGLSKKQLERNFIATVGTTPKIFSRNTRFLSICENLEELKGKTLTDLAYECGFFDQAHFTKEFKAFSGFTPKAFFEKENIYFSEI